MTDAPGRIAVVVVAYGGRDEIAATVARALTLPGCTRVVVVDNGGDGAGDVAAAAGAEVVRRPDNPGFGTSQNVGVDMVDEPYVLLLNPDAEVVGAGIAYGLQVLESQREVAAVQGIVVNRGTGQPERSAGAELRPIHLVGRALGARRLLSTRLGQALARRVGVADHVDRVAEAPIEVEWLAATALLVRRSAFRAVGGFSEEYFLYGEDLDLCRRLRAAGWQLRAVPVRWAEHAGGGTSSSGWERELHWWRGTLRFVAATWGGRGWAVAEVAAVLQWLRLVARRPLHAGAAWRSLVADPRRDRQRSRRAETTSGSERRTAMQDGPTQSSSRAS